MAGDASTFQQRVDPWLMACFGEEISRDKIERNHRFLEEALELVQSLGCTGSEAHQLVDYVFDRDIGEPFQECGGVKVTLAALCLANDLDLDAAGETELARIWTKVDKIRAKQAAKPKHSPLPVARISRSTSTDAVAVKALEWKYDSSDKYVGKTFVAESILGEYIAQETAAYFDNELLSSTGDLDDAKAAAQADYETRIRSALTHHSAREILNEEIT